MIYNRMMATALSAAIGLSALSSSAEAVLASVKTFGMAATGVAYSQDALAAAFNPAGPVEVCDRIDGGFTWSRDTGHATISGNIFDSIPQLSREIGGPINGKYHSFRTKDFYAADFGINKRLGECYEWAVGLVCYNRNFNKTTYSKPFNLFGTSKPGLEYLNQTVSPYVAYRINESFNVGISLNCQIERLKVNGVEKFDNALRSTNPGHVTNRGYNWAVGWGATIGAQWHIIDALTFGATYQPRTSMPKLTKYDGFIAKGKLDVPEMWSVGLAWKYCDRGTIAFDVQQYVWSGVHALSNTLLNNGFVEKLGSKNGPGFGFQDQTFYRLGIDYMLSCEWTVRAGFRYGRQPYTKSQTAVNQFIMDCPVYFVTAGASFRPNDQNELSMFTAYGFKNKIKGDKSIPAGIPVPIPGFQFNPQGFGGGESNLESTKFALGFSWGRNY